MSCILFRLDGFKSGRVISALGRGDGFEGRNFFVSLFSTNVRIYIMGVNLQPFSKEKRQ